MTATEKELGLSINFQYALQSGDAPQGRVKPEERSGLDHGLVDLGVLDGIVGTLSPGGQRLHLHLVGKLVEGSDQFANVDEKALSELIQNRLTPGARFLVDLEV